MNRKHEQAVLLDKLGQFFGPLLKVAANPTGYDSEERRRIEARFFAEGEEFVHAVGQFCRGEPGHHYVTEQQKVTSRVYNIVHGRGGVPGFDLLNAVTEAHQVALEAICSVPIPIDSTIHDAVTPFSTYCLVHDLCATADKQITWMDRYFDQTIFARYLADVPRNAVVTLITYPETKCVKPADKQRHADFMGVSKLYAAERGPTGYRLLTDDGFHDRLLRCNDKLFALGGSIKELGKDTTFTMAKLDGTPENLKKVNDAAATAVEVFGPGHTTHP